ncbi:MAG: hypothetical protein IKR05_03040 [Prevotella sp.]|nr:hypothetical protein [Prevotella sp.]
MKKVLLTLVSLALTSTTMLAYTTGGEFNSYGVKVDESASDNVQTITLQQAGAFANFCAYGDFNQSYDSQDWPRVIFKGPMNDADIAAIGTQWWQDEDYQWHKPNFENATLLDFSEVTTPVKPFILYNNNYGQGSHTLVIWPVVSECTIEDRVAFANLKPDNGAQTADLAYYTDGNSKILNIPGKYVVSVKFDALIDELAVMVNGGYHTYEALNFAYTWESSTTVDYNTNIHGDGTGNSAPNFFTKLSQIPFKSINFQGVNISSLGKNFSNLNNAATNYIILPSNTSEYSADNDFATYTYPSNIYVAAAFGSTESPYGVGANLGGKNHSVTYDNFATSINCTYLVQPNKLQGGAAYLPSVMQNAERLVLVGNVGAEDIPALNHVTSKFVDMSEATLVNADIKNYSNDATVLLGLPNNTTKEDVDALYATMSLKQNFKGLATFVMDAIDKTDNNQAVAANTLISYTKEEGNVYHLNFMLRDRVAGGNYASNVEHIIMSGNLNARDICIDATKTIESVNQVLGSDGHLYAYGNLPEGVADDSAVEGALSGAPILTIDFTNAIFHQPSQDALDAYKTHCPQYYTADEKKELVTDMNLSALGYKSASTSLLLPTDASQKVIPAHFMNTQSMIHELCIPSNFQYFMDYAFNHIGIKLQHIYTDAANEDGLLSTAVDNGWDLEADKPWSTYTLASTVKYIAIGAFDTGETNTLSDVYVLAKIAPVCEKSAFNSVKLVGNNGFKNVTPISRDNYMNDNSWIAYLHFPNALDDEAKKLYTDIDREYWLKDETGAVDGDGNPISWPCHAEFMRSLNQANLGYTWNDWDTRRIISQGDNRFGQPIVWGTSNPYGDWSRSDGKIQIATSGVWPDTGIAYNEDTQTWTTVADQSTDCEKCDFASHVGWHQFLLATPGYFYEKEEVNYRKTPWYSFCVPYDMTLGELKEYLGGNEGQDPEVRTLFGVNRYTEPYTSPSGKHTPGHTVEIVISRDLLTHNGGTDIVTYGQTDQKKASEYVAISRFKTVNGVEEPVYVKGGYPYFVRGWVPTTQENPENLAAYVLGKAQFTNEHLGQVAIIEEGEVAEQKMYAGEDGGYVAMPYFDHTVDAYDVVAGKYYGERGDGDEDYKYNYVGNFDILEDGDTKKESKYIYHMDTNYKAGTSKINRLTEEGSQWNVFKCDISHKGKGEVKKTIIAKTPSFGSTYPGVETDAVWTAENGGSFSAANFVVVFEEDLEGQTDGIQTVENATETVANNGKVYNVNGQLVGDTMNNLPKGIYVVNGKKVIKK